MQQVRWFVRVLNKWNVENTRFEPANEPVEAGFSLRILLFVFIMTSLSEKIRHEKAWFYTPKTL